MDEPSNISDERRVHAFLFVELDKPNALIDGILYNSNLSEEKGCEKLIWEGG